MSEVFMFSVEGISSIVGLVLTMIFSYFPELKEWYAGQKSYVKSLIMIGMIVISTGVLAYAAGNGYIAGGENMTIDKIIQIFFMTLLANQGGYAILPQLPEVSEIKESRDALG